MLKRALLPALFLKSVCSLGILEATCSAPCVLACKVQKTCISTMSYKAVPRGSKNTDNYKVYFGMYHHHDVCMYSYIHTTYIHVHTYIHTTVTVVCMLFILHTCILLYGYGSVCM